MAIALGVNIDHVATVRNARGGSYPCPIQAALLAEANGADGITAHLREDRRHITDADIVRLKASIQTRLNLEMANTSEMVRFAAEIKPYMVTLVPERRQELTTEGGLDVVTHQEALRQAIAILSHRSILVSLFIDADVAQVEASAKTGADFVEFHTGPYCHQFLTQSQQHQAELQQLFCAADKALSLGLRVNAGHGLTVNNVAPILALPGLEELNIGHSLISDAIFMGLGPAVSRMKALLQ